MMLLSENKYDDDDDNLSSREISQSSCFSFSLFLLCFLLYTVNERYANGYTSGRDMAAMYLKPVLHTRQPYTAE